MEKVGKLYTIVCLESKALDDEAAGIVRTVIASKDRVPASLFRRAMVWNRAQRYWRAHEAWLREMERQGVSMSVYKWTPKKKSVRVRKTWGPLKPVTRIVASKKVYSRKEKHRGKENQ